MHIPHIVLVKYRNRKLDISAAPTKAKSRDPAYAQALSQNKIDRQRVRSMQRVRQLWWMVFGVQTSGLFRGVDMERCLPPLLGEDNFFYHVIIHIAKMGLLHASRV